MKSPKHRVNSKEWPQYLAIFSASIMSFSTGLHFAWPSLSLPMMLSEDFPMNITQEEADYVTVIAPLGNIIGAPLSAILVDHIGRKNIFLLSSIPIFIAWFFYAYAQDDLLLCIGRLVSGIGEGLLFIMHPMYAGEITEPHIRGLLGCSHSVSHIVGMLAINCYGPYLSIKNSAYVSCIFPVIAIFVFIWMPESPYYLLMKGRVEEAKKSLYFLRRCDINKDLEVLQHDVQRQMSERGSITDMLKIKSNRKALLIMMGIRTVQQMSGISALALFTPKIFNQAAGVLSPVISTIIYLVTQLIMTTCGSVIIDKYGRKPLLIISSVGTGIMLIIGGIYFLIKETTGFDISSVSWIPIIVMLFFIITYGVGLGTVPSLMLGELFSVSIKGKALCLICIHYSILVTISSKLFPMLMKNYGIFVVFFVFGILSFISVIFSYYFVPETKGKSLEDIQQFLKGNFDHIVKKKKTPSISIIGEI